MQMHQAPLTLRQRLIDAVDESYHVKDMGAVVEVLGTLERLPVTKELLEQTRLGKTVNEFRKKINDEKLAKRAKALVKKWRDAVLTAEAATTAASPSSSLPATQRQQQQPPLPLDGNTTTGVLTSPVVTPPKRGSPPSLSLRPGHTSNSSSPKLMPSSVKRSTVSPNAMFNTNSLSPRVLASATNHSNSTNLASRNGQLVNRSAAPTYVVSSPSIASSSSPSLSLRISVSSSSPKVQLRESSPYASGSPRLTTSSNHSKNVQNTHSYAPNVEVVARTNAANKRLRIDDSPTSSPGSPSLAGPPQKKAKLGGMMNGSILYEGPLDDPSILLDEHSKDSIASRASDNSDGSSSKPSVVVLSSAAPSPLSATHDLSPPPSVGGSGVEIIGIGADIPSSDALISQQQLVENQIATSNDIDGATTSTVLQNVVPPPQPTKRGRKKKQKVVVDDSTETQLRQKIAQAQQENKVRTIHRLSMELQEEESNKQAEREQYQFKSSAALSTEDPVMRNDFVENYLKSQNELRTKMERQYQDAVKRNEIPIYIPEEQRQQQQQPEEGKKKKKRDKKKAREQELLESSQKFPSEAEILARLPPIDAQILEELKNFQFDVPASPPAQPPQENEDQIADTSKSGNETEFTSLNNNSNSTINAMQQESVVKEPEVIVPLKPTTLDFDWGDSDEDDEVPIKQEEEVVIASSSSILMETPPVTEEPTLPPESTTTLETEAMEAEDVVDSSSCVNVNVNLNLNEEDALNTEINEADVERLLVERVENLNGNVDKLGVFKEWHEVLTVKSVDGDLHILPYTIIDF